MWRTTSRTSTPSPTCRSQLECATTSPACRSRSRPTPSRTSWTTRPVVPVLCFPCSALSCGSQRCGFHRRTSICVERPVARLRCASSRALHAQVVQEVADALTTTRAVARLHGKTTSFVGGVVASVGTLRLLCFLAMQAFRLAVASLLCYGGAYFIGNTIALSDLILNCIALDVRSSFRHAMRGFGVRAQQVHVGRWDAVRGTVWVVRAHDTRDASTDARYPRGGAGRKHAHRNTKTRGGWRGCSLCWKSTSSFSQASRRET